MADTVSVNVTDVTVPSENHINIAVINQPNPVTGYAITADELKSLLQIPKYLIEDASTGDVITGMDYYKYFPSSSGGGGGGGGGTVDAYTKAQTNALLNYKVDKVNGKGLSQEDYTSTEKSKLAGIANNANNYSLPAADASTLGGVKVGTGLNVAADGTLSNGYSYTLPTATDSTLGGVMVDTALNDSSTNPVQNKVISETIGDINTVLEGVL